MTDNLCNKQTENNDVEYANKWKIPFSKHRIMFGNEIPEDKTINNVMLKSIASGGDVFKARVAYGNINTYKMRSLAWIFANNLPRHNHENADCFQNMLYFNFPCKFVEDPDIERSEFYVTKRMTMI